MPLHCLNYGWLFDVWQSREALESIADFEYIAVVFVKFCSYRIVRASSGDCDCDCDSHRRWRGGELTSKLVLATPPSPFCASLQMMCHDEYSSSLCFYICCGVGIDVFESVASVWFQWRLLRSSFAFLFLALRSSPSPPVLPFHG